MAEPTTSFGSTLSQKIQELQDITAEGERKIGAKERCVPTMAIAGAVIPLLAFLFFFFLQPGVVQKKEGNKFVRDGKKVFYWTIGVTLVLWVGMYIFTYCRGYQKSSMFCLKK